MSAIKEVIFLVHPLSFKRGHLNQVRENEETKRRRNERKFFKAYPLRFLYVKLRGPLVPGAINENFCSFCFLFDSDTILEMISIVAFC